jgi:hypothetical protein
VTGAAEGASVANTDAALDNGFNTDDEARFFLLDPPIAKECRTTFVGAILLDRSQICLLKAGEPPPSEGKESRDDPASVTTAYWANADVRLWRRWTPADVAAPVFSRLLSAESGRLRDSDRTAGSRTFSDLQADGGVEPVDRREYRVARGPMSCRVLVLNRRFGGTPTAGHPSPGGWRRQPPVGRIARRAAFNR